MSHMDEMAKRIDWGRLLRQKAWLVRNSQSETAFGLLNLVDAIQDAALNDGIATEAELFGLDAEGIGG